MSSGLPEPDGGRRQEHLILGMRRNVLVLSLTSFLTDASNNMVFPLMALFLDNVLGVKPSLIGLVEGIVDCAASLLKMLSGWLSDRLGERKRLIAGGYWTSTVAKAFLVIASSWWFVLLIRLVDRVGKGLRAAPAQALVADASRADQEGRSFGFYKMMDAAGGMVGLLATAGIVFWVQGGHLLLARHTYQVLVLAAMIPALCGALLVTLRIRERQHTPSRQARPSFLGWQNLDPRFWRFLLLTTLFALGSFSTAFLALRAQDVGASAVQVVLLLVGYQAVYSLVSWPAGALSDRIGRKRVLIGSWGLHGLVYAGFALARSAWHIWALYLLYGLYSGTSKGVERAFIADLVPGSDSRGAAYGLYNAAIGLVALPASAIAGVLWQTHSPAASFLWGAALSLSAALLLAVWAWRSRLP
jgi:MFS family permease